MRLALKSQNLLHSVNSMKWIKHDTDANLDAKLQNVMLDYGLEGYGLYWYCIELIAGNVTKDNITFELEHDARIIAKNTGSTAQKVEEMMRYFVRLGLFEESGNAITCFKIARRLDKSMTSNPEMREIIEKLKNHDEVMTQSGRNHDGVMQDQTRLDQNRIDKTRKTPTSTSQAKIDPREDEIKGIFEYWRKTMNKDSRAKLTQKRRSKVNARLEDGFSPREICLAIKGCAMSPHHMGDNDTGAIYDDLELICRDDAKVKRFISIAQKQQQPYSSTTAKNIETLNNMEFD